jgi:hypothetical protein
MNPFGMRLADLHKVLPCIVAELAVDVSFQCGSSGRLHHDRGTRAYFLLRGQNPLDEPDAEVFVRSKLNVLKLRELPWDHFRFAEIAMVPAAIGERCWRGTPDEMKEMLERVRLKIPNTTLESSKFQVPLDQL